MTSIHIYHPYSVNNDAHVLQSTFNSVSVLIEKTRTGMLAEAKASMKDTIVKESEIIRQKSISDITAQTTIEEKQVPLPVSG